jgi:hypothetical protein
MPTVLRWTAKALLAGLLLMIVAAAGFRAAAAWRESADSAPPPDGQLVHTAQGAIFIEARGPADGAPVLLVHGTAAWSGFWLSVAEALGMKDMTTR